MSDMLTMSLNDATNIIKLKHTKGLPKLFIEFNSTIRFAIIINDIRSWALFEPIVGT